MASWKTWAKSLALAGLGGVLGAGAGVGVWDRLHPPVKPRPDVAGAPGPGSLAPPLGPPEEEPEPPPEFEPGPPGPEPQPPPDPGPVAKPLDPPKAEGKEFFGFPVGSTAAAPAPKPEPRPEPKQKPKPPAIAKLRFMKDRCVAGFDGKSTLHDFSGWTKAVTGEIEFEKGRLAETAKASVTVDARTLDTGDKGRDEEMHENVIESARFTEMKFVLASVRLGEGGSAAMKGSMEIHGVPRELEIPITLALRRDGCLYVKGEVRAKVSDFGIAPPSKLGMINVEDEIRIWFEAWAEPVREVK